MLEHSVRDVLNRTAQRRFAVLDPVKVVIEDYPEGQVEELSVPNNPEDPDAGSRLVPFSRELWIERDDFMEEPAPKFFRLAPGARGASSVGVLHHLHIGGQGRDGPGRRAALQLRPCLPGRGVAGWPTSEGDPPLGLRGPRRARRGPRLRAPVPVARSAARRTTCSPTSTRSRRSSSPTPASKQSLADVPVGETVQFERLGYFVKDPDSAPDALVFDRTVTLKDTWAKVQARG